MLRAYFEDSGVIMEWFHGGLTKRRFKQILAELIDEAVPGYDCGIDDSAICTLGEYKIYCEVEHTGKGKMEVIYKEKVIFVRHLNDVYEEDKRFEEEK